MSAARPIRVLIVDDSAVVRKLVSDELRSDPEIEVVGTAIIIGVYYFCRLNHWLPRTYAIGIFSNFCQSSGSL
jgi:CheY-like chemotaxis protein